MLSVQSVKLTQFKNYDSGSFEFSVITGICGLNGIGKTNLLDAVYYSCFTKSYFSLNESMNSRFGTEGFRIDASFEKEGKRLKVESIYRGGKKEVLLDGTPYEKLSHHLGTLPVVMIAPDDIELISGASEKRRRYLDAMLSQADAAYLENLIAYNRMLQQRNSLLRQPVTGNKPELLDIYDRQLAMPGSIIHQKRKAFCDELSPLVSFFYSMIAGPQEQVNIKYYSKLEQADFYELLKQSRERDIMSARSNTGIHKDDLELALNGQLFRHIASQGQRKSMLFALKLAEYQLLRKMKGFSPILLLDDVFEKLDDNRMLNLLKWVCRQNAGQVLITDTHRQRLEDAYRSLDISGKIIELK